MSKQVIAAIEQQGCYTPITLPKQSILVNQIHALIESQLLLPMDSGADHFAQLEVLFKTIRDIASAADDSGLQSALLNIKSLAKSGAYQAAEIGNFIGVGCDTARHEHMPTILAAVGGEE